MREDLYEKVLFRLGQEQKKRHVRQILLSAIFLCASCIGTVFFFLQLQTQLASSGLFSYLRMIASDTTMIIRYWDDFVFLIGESIPAFTLVAFLTTIFILLGSIRFILKSFTHTSRTPLHTPSET